MGACMHTAGVTCDNCRWYDHRQGWTLIGQLPATPQSEFVVTFAAQAEVAALTARLAALEAEVARLTEKLTPKETPPNSCPECESTDVQRLPWTLTSEPPQQPWACRACNHRWNTYC